MDFVGEEFWISFDLIAQQDLLCKVTDTSKKDWIDIVVRENLQKFVNLRFFENRIPKNIVCV